MMFAYRLVNSNAIGKRINSGKLRSDFIDFLTHGMLNDISDNNVITKFYKRWTNIFDSTNIYEEVAKKLEVVDDYKQNLFSKRLEIASAIIFPTLFIGNIATLGILNTNQPVSVHWWQMLVITAVTLLLYPLIIFFRSIGKGIKTIFRFITKG